MPHNRVVQMPIFRKKIFLKRKFLKIKKAWVYLSRVRVCMYAYTYMCIFIYKVYIIYIVIFIFIKDFLLIC